jgi:periplasmic protein TonB
VAALLAGCATPPSDPFKPPSDPKPVALPTSSSQQPDLAPVVVASSQPSVQQQPVINGPVSLAKTPKEYRRDAAKHLYGKNKDRVYRGRMPPLLYAVGTLHVGVNSAGMVDYVYWMRAPSHAPEVMAEIEKMVKAAAPYPASTELGGVVYTDTWLWDKSGRFQLDTLTEGQDGEVRSRLVAQNEPLITDKPPAAKPAAAVTTKPATPTSAKKPVAKK